MSYKYTYPSIEYVLATGHYPEPCRKSVRHHPTFFPAPPVQVFHIAYGHVPVFIPLPSATYGYSTHTRRHVHNGAFWPRNRSFTVTVPSSVANKNLLSRTTSSESIATPLEPSSRTAMGVSVMTMTMTSTRADAASFETTSIDTFAAFDDHDTRSGKGVDEHVDASSLPSDEMSESSRNESDVETMPPLHWRTIADEENRLEESAPREAQHQVPSSSQIEEQNPKDNARALHVNKPQVRALSNSSAHNTNSAAAGSSTKLADRQHASQTMLAAVRRRRGLPVRA